MVCWWLLSLQHMVAGAVAGITEHTAMYPVDTIKTRMQALSHPGQRVRLPGLPLVVRCVQDCLRPLSLLGTLRSRCSNCYSCAFVQHTRRPAI
jgi:hypothetical protein